MSDGVGPLSGIRIVEIAGLGPAPFCGMMLSDMGADVIRIDRAALVRNPDDRSTGPDLLNRGRRSVGIDLKDPEGVELVLQLIEGADGLIEGFRPGVMERLGLAPEVCLGKNPKLVFGRMTGWGQDGPLSLTAGHDIDYIALSGVLHAIGKEAPVPPLNLVGDFGGGGMFLAFGMVTGILHATRTGVGQVVDASMVDGSAVLSTMIWALSNMGAWDLEQRSANMLDGAAPWYDSYETADGRHMAVGAIEPQFYVELLRLLALDPATLPRQHDRDGWPMLRSVIGERFKSKTLVEWALIFEDSDACVAPVLTFTEAANHPHNMKRGTFVAVDNVMQPSPAPRFSSSTLPGPGRIPHVGSHTSEILTELGISADEINTLRQRKIVG